MMMRSVVVLAVAVSQTALAAGFDYSVVGNGCTPDNVSIQNDLYENRGHGVGFKPGRYGTIRLTCPITLERHQASCWGCAVGSSGRTWHSYTLYYKDSDGAATGTYLNVQLRYANFSSPAVGLSWVSSTPALAPTGPTSFKVDFTDVDPGLYAFWWVEVRLTRNAWSSADVEFLGITVE